MGRPDLEHGPEIRSYRPEWAKSALPKEDSMLYTIAIVLLVLWVLGLVTSTTIGGFVHILLVIAVIVVVLQLVSGRR